jgi:hypothetical protein
LFACFPGFHLEPIQRLLATALNPIVTVPLYYLLVQHMDRGRVFALDNPQLTKQLRILVYLCILWAANRFLNEAAQNNWTGFLPLPSSLLSKAAKAARPGWNQELVVVTGGSEGIGKLLVLKFAEKNVRTIVLDIQEPTYPLRESGKTFLPAFSALPCSVT